MGNMWDDRYSAKEYIYGRIPNSYFRDEIDKLKPGKLLLPGEGEGRNAVYAAMAGWNVFAFDSSVEGRKKAVSLADEMKVSFEYKIADINEITLPPEEFDLIAIIYIHLPADVRKNMHDKFVKSLKKGGVILLEAFSKSQINNSSGGPRDIRMLYSADELRNDFKTLKIIDLLESRIYLDEGTYHKGTADVIRLKATL